MVHIANTFVENRQYLDLSPNGGIVPIFKVRHIYLSNLADGSSSALWQHKILVILSQRNYTNRLKPEEDDLGLFTYHWWHPASHPQVN